MTIHSLGYLPVGAHGAPGLPRTDADEIAGLVLEAERLAYGRIDMGDREAGPSARTRIRVKFEEILDRCGDSVERTDLMTQTCKALIAGAIHPDAPLGMIGSLSVRLACLHYLAEWAKRTRCMPGLATMAPALATAWAMREAAKKAYLAGDRLDVDRRAMVRIDPDIELLLPMTHPARQALYRADTSA